MGDKYETRVTIDGQVFQGSDLKSIHTENVLCGDTFEIGQTACAQIELEITKPTTPFVRMAEIVPEIRKENETQWREKGHFFISTRPVSGDTMKITGYDGMRKTAREVDFSGISFPASTKTIAQRIAQDAGISIAAGTLDALDDGTTIPNPDGYTGREILGYIAAMHGGSFRMTDDGKLQFVDLVSILKDSNISYLINEKGACITFGGVRILV